jgi:Uri superfamily endonuclease
MKSAPGTYALVLRSHSKAIVQIGLWGRIALKPGYYIYIGSAFGPGGVKARVLRHYRRIKSHHWHIDYLREFVSPTIVWYSHEARRLDHKWAQALSEKSCISPIKGFGCSDCKCYSHLFYTSNALSLATFSDLVGDKVELWSKQITG